MTTFRIRAATGTTQRERTNASSMITRTMLYAATAAISAAGLLSVPALAHAHPVLPLACGFGTKTGPNGSIPIDCLPPAPEPLPPPLKPPPDDFPQPPPPPPTKQHQSSNGPVLPPPEKVPEIIVCALPPFICK
jgi:hypothetical protein